MTWRIAITHTTGYHYRREVTSSYNEARITPISSDRQLVLDSEVTVTPPAVAFRYWDYWGTLVHAFDIHVPHIELSVTGTSVVETSGRPDPPDEVLSWSDLARPDLRDRFAELLAPTTHVPLDDELRAAAEPFLRESSPAAACEAAVEWVKGSLRYEKGTTNVSTPAHDVLRQGSGVCQDFAHVTLAILRSAGIPARYVSGYLHPAEDAEVGLPTVGESHAWIEAWTGDWQSFDPTNGAVAERHVVVGRARDYSDLSPLHGIYHGGPAEALGVSVELTRLS
jgi:transglutaminase-like putative cysteine protease